jgi:hypothetical protein
VETSAVLADNQRVVAAKNGAEKDRFVSDVGGVASIVDVLRKLVERRCNMDRDKFVAMVQKLPPGTKILVRGGGGWHDDAWVPTIRVFSYNDKLTAVVEYDKFHNDHYNYPENYTGVTEVTDQYIK